MGIYDVTDAFSDLLVAAQRHRPPPGEYVGGRWEEDAAVVTPILVVAHPSEPNEVNTAELQGYQGGSLMTFFTETEIRTTSNDAGVLADRIVYASEQYEVLRVSDWDNIGGYHVAICERK